MKYYWKHLVRIVRQKPLQPLLMLVILLLSFLVENTAISATEAINREEIAERVSAVGNAQVTVAVGASSSSRFLTEKAVTDVLPQAQVTGSFGLPFLQGDNLVTGYALDCKKAQDFFTFSWVCSETVSKNELDTIVYVTADFAEENGLQVGDKLSLSLFGKVKTFTVKGIARQPFLGDGDVICDISGIVADLVGQSKLISVFTEEVSVYGKLYVRCEGMTDEEICAALSPTLSSYAISTTDRSHAVADTKIFRGIALVITVFCVITSLAVLIGCSYCLSKEREEFTALFCLVGFSKKTTYLLRVGELLIYALVAIGLGSLLSYPVGQMFYEKMGLRFEHFTLTFVPTLVCVLCLVSVCFVSPALAEKKGKRTGSRKTFPRLGLVSLGGFAVCLILSFVLPTAYKFVAGVMGVVTLALSLALLVEPLLDALVSRRLRKKVSVPIRLARKNCQHVGELTNSCRLLAVLLASIGTTAFLVISIRVGLPIYKNTINGEYVVAGGNSAAKEKLLALDQVEEVYCLRQTNNWTLEDAHIIRVWGVDNLDVFKYEFKGETLPAVNEILCCTFMQEGYGIPRTGDFQIHIGKNVETYRVSHTSDSGFYPVFVTNYEGVTDATDYYVVKGAEGVDKTELYSAITSALSAQMVTVMPSESLLSHYISLNKKYINFCDIMLIGLSVFGVLGIGNNLVESLRSRREELNSFLVCGMTRGQVRAMLRKEFAVVLLLALAAGFVAFVFLSIVACNATKSFAANILGIYRFWLVNLL